MYTARIVGGAWWVLLAVLSVGVGGYALFHTFTGFAHLPLRNPMFEPWGLRTHIATSGFALILGVFQFLKPLRRQAPSLHRWMGRGYVLVCVVGGLAGGIIALSSTAGPVAGWGFFLLAILWVPFTLLALTSAMRRDFISHEKWMIRSFALTLGAVTLRLQLLGVELLDLSFRESYPLIAWLAWVPNLLIAELWIATRPRFRRPRKMAPAATPA